MGYAFRLACPQRDARGTRYIVGAGSNRLAVATLDRSLALEFPTRRDVDLFMHFALPHQGKDFTRFRVFGR